MRWMLSTLILFTSAVVLTLVTAGSTPARAIRAAFPLTAIQTVNARVGWGVSNRIVFRTTDGGRNWTDVMPCGIPTRHELATFFLSANDAWIATVPAANPKIVSRSPAPVTVFRTVNGGRTWQRFSVPIPGSVEPFNRLTFANARVGWLWLNEGVSAGNAYYVLLRTADGGQHWTRTVSGEQQPSRSPDQAPANFPSCDCATAVTFQNSAVGWATGANLIPPAPFLWITRDSGYRWQHQTLRIRHGYRFGATYAPIFFDQQDGILPVQLAREKSIDVFDAYVTRDGGRTWMSTAPLVLSEPAQRAPIPVFSFTDRLHGWVSSGWNLYRTSDGGHHWMRLRPRGPYNAIVQLDFTDSKRGFAVLQFINGSFPTHLLQTANGGQSWRAVSTYIASHPAHPCRSVVELSDSYGLAH